MCQKAPPKIGGTGAMSPGIQKDHWSLTGSTLTSTAVNPYPNPFDKFAYPKETQAAAAPSKTIGITVDQVSNGYIIKVRQQGTTVERIVSDFENLGSEIMVALAEIQLGK